MERHDEADPGYRVALRRGHGGSEVITCFPRFTAFEAGAAGGGAAEALLRLSERLAIEARLAEGAEDEAGLRVAARRIAACVEAWRKVECFAAAHAIDDAAGRVLWAPFLHALRKLVFVAVEQRRLEWAAFERYWDPQVVALYWRTLLEQGFASWIAIVHARDPGAGFDPPHESLAARPSLAVVDALKRPRPRPGTIAAHLRGAIASHPKAFSRIAEHIERERGWIHAGVHGKYAKWSDGNRVRSDAGLRELVGPGVALGEETIAAAFVRIGQDYVRNEAPRC